MGQQLSLATIGNVRHGAVEMMVNEALDAIVRDLRDRPAVVADREVTIKIKAKPPEAKENFEDADVSFSVTTKIPERSVSTRMLDSMDGLEFQGGAPDNPRQKTLPIGSDDE